MKRECETWLVVVGTFFLAFGIAPFGSAQSVVPPGPTDVDAAIERLASPKIAERLQASRALRTMGANAHAALSEIAAEGDAESAGRALEILEEASKSKNEELSTSAKKVLGEIAGGEGPNASRAEQILNPKPPGQRFDARGFPFRPPNNRMGLGNPFPGARPNPFGGGAPAANVRIHIRSVNGVREIKVVTGGREFQFRDVPGGLEVTRPDGKGGKKKQVHKDSADLKQNDTDAWNAYQKAGGDRGGAPGRIDRMIIPQLQRRLIPNPNQPNLIPRPAVPRPVIPKAPRLKPPKLPTENRIEV